MEFFRGTWVGDGELTTHLLLRWFAPNERLHFTCATVRVSDSAWIVTDRIAFSSGEVIDRKMHAELVAPDRIRVTADDMPEGADVLLHESGFRFTPYDIVVRHRGLTLRVRCLDENTVDRDGFIHDLVRIYFFGFPVAVMRIGPIARHDAEAAERTFDGMHGAPDTA
jgi:hypothetical protein